MTEHKFTDDEIIRALECCSGNGNCKDCPYDKTGCEFEKDALDLINRQKAEIERLRKYDEERDIRLHARLKENARAEAIKEFAERLKEQANRNDLIYYRVDDTDIDKLVKEMTEGKE